MSTLLELELQSSYEQPELLVDAGNKLGFSGRDQNVLLTAEPSAPTTDYLFKFESL